MATKILPDGLKEMLPGGSCGMKKGSIILQEGEAMGALEMEVTVTLEAAADDGDGLATAARDAILSKLSLYLSYNVGPKGHRKEPHQGTTFIQLRDFAREILGEDMDGYTDSTTGLAKALVEGDNELVFTMPVSTGYLKAMKESEKIGGMGPAQALTTDVLVKGAGDGVNAVDSNVTLTGLSVAFKPRTHPVAGNQWDVLPEFRTEEESDKDSITLPDALHLAVDDVDAALASTTLQRVKVTVDETVVTEDVTPGAIVRDFEKRFPTETTITASKGTVTPIFRGPPGPLATAYVGELVAKQVDDVKAWVTQVAYKPAFPLDDTASFVEAMANAYKPGDTIHCVLSVKLEGIPVTHPYLAFSSFRGFKVGEDRQAELYPGLRCRYGGKPSVYIPEDWLQRSAPAWLAAKQRGQEEVEESIVREVASWIPGCTQSGRGFKGGRTKVLDDVIVLFRNYLDTQLRRLAAQRSAAATTASAKK